MKFLKKKNLSKNFRLGINSDSLRLSKPTIDSTKIVSMAIEFHQNTNYQGKTPNITAYYPNGALSRAFYQKYGIQLTKEQLLKVDKKQNINRGRSI